ncbi:hypothetical protein ACIRPH_08735 [Nocardiopsis sp. NPDC101807]|uniref:hypothetical protein n=1 Tax=Nocardiopsis sp. NPDC101807 TaxID=3364339 RepID=UPI0037F55E28
MMYNLLLAGIFNPVGLREALAKVFDLPVVRIDVVDEEELEYRNWDAWVSVEYSVQSGDVSCSLAVYATEDVKEKPSEEGISLGLSGFLDAVILFPAEEKYPSLWRVATPRGEVAYARLREPEDDAEVFRITDVEIPVPELPGASISRFPEVIKVLQLPTPIVDSYIPGEAEGGLWEIRGLAVNWERLTVRMATGWPPVAWYPASMYEEDLRFRDKVQKLAQDISDDDRGLVLEMLDEVDGVYRGMTVEDGGLALAEACGLSLGDFVGRPWYWLRRPYELPWRAE